MNFVTGVEVEVERLQVESFWFSIRDILKLNILGFVYTWWQLYLKFLYTKCTKSTPEVHKVPTKVYAGATERFRMIVDEDHLLEMVDIILTTKIRFYLKQKKNL